MELNMNYFYITVHFHPIIDMPSMDLVSENTYRSSKNTRLYRKRSLYDCGWGQELGYEMLPPLCFIELIELVTKYDREDSLLFREREKMSNLLGAVSVIMQDHIEELINFLSEKIETDFFEDQQIKENFKWFAFDKEIAGAIGGIGQKSYEDVLNMYSEWCKMSLKVKQLVYGL